MSGLDYGYRSKCCQAPIKLGHTVVKKTKIRKSVWVCLKCGSRDVNIIPKSEVKIQE